MCYYVAFSLIALVLIAGIFIFISGNMVLGFYPMWLITLSITTFVMYAIDKLMAQRQGARTPEAVLHVLALLGGFPGGWLGMFALQHKSNIRKHPDFYAVLAFSTVIHGVAIWLQFRAGG